MKTICIISGYPSPARPTAMAFVQQIAHGFAREGCRIVVVSPVPYPRSRNRLNYPYRQEEGEYESGGSVVIYRPLTLSFGNMYRRPWMGVFNPARVASWFSQWAVRRVLQKEGIVPDVFYGHFIDYGVMAAKVAKRYGKKSFVGVGESGFDFVNYVGMPYYRKTLQGITAFIPNASHLVPVLKELFGVPQEKLHVLPNGINPQLFYPRDRELARGKLGISQGAFVVGSTGHFIFRKGINRVAEAIRGLEGVCGIFAGKGELPPEGPNVVCAAPVNHDDLPEFLSACDVFVLPTLSEGCCNAIVEAMACGLPIITSNNKYVADQVDETCSIRVDPMDVGALRDAILLLKNNGELRARLSRAAAERATLFDINARIQRILGIFDK